jgi:hypothetical protein
MEYKKPQILSVAKATDAIQSMGKPHGNIDVADSTSQFPSVGTYESDE